MFQAKSVLPGSIFILDNSSTHHCSVFLDAVIAIGCAYVFLPAYSPDFNAIGSPLCSSSLLAFNVRLQRRRGIR